MHIDTKLSSDLNADPGNHLKEFDHINAVGGYALILTAIAFLTACFSCCWKKYTLVKTEDQRTSNVTVITMNPSVSYMPNSGTNGPPAIQINWTGTAEPSNTAAFPKPRGLINNINTCYFNSVMQALAQTTILEKQLRENPKNPGNMTKELAQFYVSMHDSEPSAYNPQRLQRLMFKRTGKFGFGIQHDGHECLLNILHELKKDEGQGRGGQLTMVDKIFGGHTMTVYVCNDCGTPSHLGEPFLDISLPICSSSPRKGRRLIFAKPPSSDGTHARNRPLPAFDGAKEGNPEEHKASDRDIAKSGSDFESRENRSGERKRKTRAGRSRERSPRSKVRKRSSEFTASELSQQAVSNDPELTQQEAYRRAVSLMMRTLAKGRESSDRCTLDDCLRCYTRKEQITDDYLCRECNSEAVTEDEMRLTSATKQTLIFNPPAVLTFHLKRFEVISGNYVKRDTMVHYEDVLDIGPYYTGWWKDDQSQNVWYSLYAVVVHAGTLQSGHYYAYVKVRDFDEKSTKFLQKSYLNRDDITVESLIQRMQNRISQKYHPIPVPYKEGTWYCVNDRKVKEVSAQEALSQEAFLLFYERL